MVYLSHYCHPWVTKIVELESLIGLLYSPSIYLGG